MYTRPPELADQRIVAELEAGWGLTVDAVEYLPVGFGSHHWRADGRGERWFVTVDDLDAKRWTPDETRDEGFERLEAAIATSRALRDHGLDFVVAPEPTVDGPILHRLDRFAVALYQHVEGRTHPYGAFPSADDRRAVLDLVVRLHAAPVVGPARADDFELRNRGDLDRALDDLHRPWDTGPYGEACREALAGTEPALRRHLAVYDGLAARACAQPDRMVLTHGEPHAANTILTAAGWVLVDWDTALLAPPERDIWEMARADPADLDHYTAATGRTVQTEALELYRLGWDLAEVAIYTALLRVPHERSEDVDLSWGHLQGYLGQLASE
jgi:spectinomycin phosphotransferase